MIRSLAIRLPILFLLALCSLPWLHGLRAEEGKRPNILLAISDDQSWPHASAYGSKMVSTPAFDRIAREGALFRNAFAGSPGCSPCRASLLTGRHTWQIENAGTHASYFPTKYEVYPDRLEAAGYAVGYCGKGWGPGNWKQSGRKRNPAGPSFSSKGEAKPLGKYAGAFSSFLKSRPKDKPFCFWFGSSDPHRGYAKGSGLAKGMTLDQAEVPKYLPDTPEIRSDLLDYAFEVERFDEDLGKILALLEEAGELDNTLVIVTSDNGMPFPRAKANCYEHGIHMPLAISWKKKIPAGRTIDDLVGFVDLTATIYDASGVKPPSSPGISGRSFLDLLASKKSGTLDPARKYVFSARERHSSSRYRTLGYPQRCIRTKDYLYIRNFKPERWPAGPAQKYADVRKGTLGPDHSAYHDIDACPTLSFLTKNWRDATINRYLQLATARRPAEELFDITSDPDCMKNLASDPAHAEARKELSALLLKELKASGDPRANGNGDIWETYPRVSSIRWFPEPEWAKKNPDSVPNQEWLMKRKPR